MAKSNVELIKKLRLKKGCKYLVFFPISSGLERYELECLDIPELSDVTFLLESTKGIKVIEYPSDWYKGWGFFPKWKDIIRTKLK